MNRLNLQECLNLKDWICQNRNSLRLEASVPYSDDERYFLEIEGDFLQVYIADAVDGVVGLVIIKPASNSEEECYGYISTSQNAFEQVCVALAIDENELVRAAVARACLGRYEGNLQIMDADIIAYEPLPISVMYLLANDSDAAIRGCISTSSSAPQALFEMLADDQDEFNRAMFAASTKASGEILEKLSNDPDENVRESVAKNPATPSSALEVLANDSSMKVLVGVTCNPSTPASALQELIHVDSAAVKKSVARNTNVSSETLRKLLDEADSFADVFYAGQIRELIAGNKNASSELLEELAEYPNREVRVKIAQNPNASRRAIERIANAAVGSIVIWGDWPKVIIEHPLTPTSCLEKMSFSTSVEVKRMVRDCERTPLPIRQRLSYDPALIKWDNDHPYMRRSKTGIPDSKEPRSLLEESSLSRNPYDRMEAARDRNTSPEILQRLSYDHYPQVRALVAANCNTDEESLRRLAGDPEKSVRLSLASNERLPCDAMAVLLDDNEESVRIRMAGREDIPYERLVRMASDASRSIRAAAVGNKSFPHDQAVAIATTDTILAIQQVALRDDLSESEYAQIMDAALAKYRERSGCGFDWARNTALDIVEHLLDVTPISEEVLIEIASSNYHNIQRTLAKREDLPSSVASVLADSKEDQIKIALAINPHASELAIRKLLGDKREHIRCYGLANPNAPLDVLVDKAKRGTEKEVRIVASNPGLPVDLITALAKDTSCSIRAAAASNPNLPSHILQELAADESPIVRRAVAGNVRANEDTLMQLTCDSDDEVRKTLLLREELSVDVLRQLAASIGGDSYYAARRFADNIEMLEILARNGNGSALKLLAANENTPPSTLEWIYSQHDTELIQILLHNPNMPVATSQECSEQEGMLEQHIETLPLIATTFDDDEIPF